MARSLLLALLGALLFAEAGVAQQRAHPMLGNVGIICRWNKACMAKQQHSMRQALALLVQGRVPAWKIHLCNRNASRSASKLDWTGFNHCLRNKKLKRPRGA